MSGPNKQGGGDTGSQQLLPRHRYMLQKVDAAFGIYDERSTEVMFLQPGVIDKVRELGNRICSVCLNCVPKIYIVSCVEDIYSATACFVPGI